MIAGNLCYGLADAARLAGVKEWHLEYLARKGALPERPRVLGARIYDEAAIQELRRAVERWKAGQKEGRKAGLGGRPITA